MLLQATYPTCSLMSETQDTTTLTWNPVCHITYNRDSWVKLLELPSEYSADEALLLCQESLDTWVAWVPDCGEVLLDRSNFYC
jgi:hypothetical protein